MTQMMIMLVCAAVLTGCWTAWVWCFVNKWEVSEDCTISEWLQINSTRVIGELMRCSFCFCWWLSLVFTVVFVLVTGQWILLVTPFFSTAIGRWLVGM